MNVWTKLKGKNRFHFDGLAICNECGCSVMPGSGNWANRVPDGNSIEQRRQMGKPFPVGAFMCGACDSLYSNDDTSNPDTEPLED